MAEHLITETTNQFSARGVAREQHFDEISAPTNFEDEESSNLTVEQCEELAKALAEEAALLPPGSKKEDLLNLAQSYRHLATMKALMRGS